MGCIDFIHNVYGQIRGYDRWRIARECRANEHRSAAELQREALAQFARCVHEAIAHFPAYAARVEAHMGRLPGPGLVNPADLPVWTKDDQKAFFDSLTGPPLPGAFVHHTGGSSGVPTRFYMTRESYEWRIACHDRGYAWGGARVGDKTFNLWGVIPAEPTKLLRMKAAVHDKFLNKVMFNSFQFGPEDRRACCELINETRPPVLVGFTGRLVDLALFVRDNPGVLKHHVDHVLTACEGLAPGQRELIETQLGGELFLTYGSREFRLIGIECANHDGFHLTEDNLYVEVVDDKGQPLPPGEPGRILVTDLHNAANPFIRYEIGDAGVMGTEDTCSCGLPFRRLASVDGRLQEDIVLPDGTRFTGLFFPHVMKEFRWIDAYQVYQEAVDALTIRVITAEPVITPALRAEMERLLRPSLGKEMQITIEKVDKLEVKPNGKTPAVISLCAAPPA